ncbi:Hypothetical protein NTJ_13108 [Nesidiocoris tenuis]|uniref:Secreted protein n=1 Tax=Nesidiocoris tenuis TaxID=355587 RepID=A0ABN7BAX7_9HEMI|nr:Hypothetical protein NTJ_13108 [Nesidiocoris tenuis]
MCHPLTAFLIVTGTCLFENCLTKIDTCSRHGESARWQLKYLTPFCSGATISSIGCLEQPVHPGFEAAHCWQGYGKNHIYTVVS